MDTLHELMESGGWRSRGYLPHFEGDHLIQTVTFRLGDALPRTLLDRWRAEYAGRELTQRIESALDAGAGACWLARPELAGIVEGTLLHADSERYHLLAWVIMPNHVHVIIQCRSGWPLARLVEGWKSYSARQINLRLGRQGAVWMPDYYDRFVRDERHLAAAVEYVHQNPVKAALASRAEDWPFSSARFKPG